MLKLETVGPSSTARRAVESDVILKTKMQTKLEVNQI